MCQPWPSQRLLALTFEPSLSQSFCSFSLSHWKTGSNLMFVYYHYFYFYFNLWCVTLFFFSILMPSLLQISSTSIHLTAWPSLSIWWLHGLLHLPIYFLSIVFLMCLASAANQLSHLEVKECLMQWLGLWLKKQKGWWRGEQTHHTWQVLWD